MQLSQEGILQLWQISVSNKCFNWTAILPFTFGCEEDKDQFRQDERREGDGADVDDLGIAEENPGEDHNRRA